ncbi:mini-chromosome maintenance complex-binding protein [Nematostella vectensis]|uniref:mini-chromosome maintenance complex-binding protein n=1 Tax=Nematostella vectensis TaxID=45351 RepID=UPI0013906BE5|nr:mini-chromosome maintenance complex-binding protein [Nematostella vectensis]
MPCIEDWLSSPLSVVDGICKETSGKAAMGTICEYFTQRVEENIHRIPSINDTPLHYLKPNSLVRFRCMVQDMFGPEYFLSQYEVKSKSTGETVLASGLYRDVVDCSGDLEVDFNSPKCVTSEKQTYYCVPIPGETEWAKQAFAERSPLVQHGGPSQLSMSNKRSLEDDEMEGDHTTDGHMETDSDDMSAKKTRTEETKASTNNIATTAMPSLNFPLPGEQGPACLVHLYEQCDNIKLNDTLEFIGILSVHPSLASTPGEAPSDPSFITADDVMCQEERAVHHPPPSLVPRLHCLVARPMKHSNPTMPTVLAEDSLKSLTPPVLHVRDDLLAALEKLLCGDRLAAEYLLLHLLSTVYTRSGVMAVGKFAINLSGLPTQQTLPLEERISSQVAKFLKHVLPKCHLLPMTLNNLNSLNFIPKKDYTKDRLMSGMLQLSNGTELVLDETAMEAGQLNATGVQNVTSLGNLMSWQKLAYDFNFYKTEFMVDIKVLVMSEGKSLLPSDCQVKLDPQRSADSADTVLNNINHSVIEKMRCYLGLLRFAEYSVSPEMQKVLQEDFVSVRQQTDGKMSADDFHLHLLLARLLSISYGQVPLTNEVWAKVKNMESKRRARLSVTSQ